MKHRLWNYSISIFLTTLLLLIFTQVASANQPPIADAGDDQSGLVNEVVWLIGSATDPDGDAIVLWQTILSTETVPAIQPMVVLEPYTI